MQIIKKIIIVKMMRVEISLHKKCKFLDFSEHVRHKCVIFAKKYQTLRFKVTFLNINSCLHSRWKSDPWRTCHSYIASRQTWKFYQNMNFPWTHTTEQSSKSACRYRQKNLDFHSNKKKHCCIYTFAQNVVFIFV